MKLFTYPADPRAQKVLVAAQYAGAKVEVVTEFKDKEMKTKSPTGSVPVLETENGVIFQSNAIARFLSKDNALYGKADAFSSAQIDSWVDFSANELEVAATCLVYPIIGWMSNNEAVSKKAAKDLKGSIMTLEKHLKTRTYMVGESITLADITLASTLVLPMKMCFDAKDRKPFPCVERWFTTIVNQPEFLAVIGSTTLCKKKIAAPKETAAPAKKKEEPKKKKAAAPAAPAPKKKAKHPLELLPKSSFVLDSWKKEYSNSPSDNFYSCMNYFWEKLDRSGYSVYFCTYNYNDDNKVLFMTSNLCTGFVQRCDEIRKYAFGTMQIISDVAPFEVVGCWLFRGDSAEHMLNCNPDAEYYTWTKANLDDEADKKKIADMWCAESELLGKPIQDCKVFK